MLRTVLIALLFAGCSSGLVVTTPVNMAEIVVTSEQDALIVIDCDYASVAINLHAHTPEVIPGGCVILGPHTDPVKLSIEVP